MAAVWVLVASEPLAWQLSRKGRWLILTEMHCHILDVVVVVAFNLVYFLLALGLFLLARFVAPLR